MGHIGKLTRRRFLQVTGFAAGSGGFINWQPQKSAELPAVAPVARHIFLFGTHVAGTSHIVGIEEIASQLHIGDRLDLFREPNNPFDEQAILVKTCNDVKIGYVPRAHNVIFSRLMDGEKSLYAQIASKERYGYWIRIGIRVYLQE